MKFGTQFWKQVAFVLTFANLYVHQLEDLGRPVEEDFQKQVSNWKDEICKALRNAHVSESIVEHISVHVAGAPKKRSLPGHEYWLSDLWANIFMAVKRNAKHVYLRLTHNRITEEQHTNEEDFTKELQEQPIVYTRYVDNLLGKAVAEVLGHGARPMGSDSKTAGEQTLNIPHYSLFEALGSALTGPPTHRKISASVLVASGAYILYKSL